MLLTFLCSPVADALEALELFNELLTVPELEGALKGYIPQLMQFMLSLVTAKVDMHLRDQAMTFVQNVAISRTKQFVSNKARERGRSLMCSSRAPAAVVRGRASNGGPHVDGTT